MTCPRLFAMFIALTVLLGSVQFDLNSTGFQASPQSPLPQTDELKAQQLSDQIATSEWLGPMAPIALSPFFGITCLSGMSVYGQGTFLADNQFVSSNPVLNNPAVFWTFLILTLLTSLPRLTKVSKPIAQVLDQVETYSGIITIIVIRIMASAGGEPSELADTQIIQMGFISLTGDMLLVVAAAINIFVINLVKFFFEALIWLTPIPAIDAIFEACNKIACATLMAIYAWSPLVATILNLILFTVCALMFRWVHRGAVYMRTMLTDPIWVLLNQGYGQFGDKKQLVVFPQKEFGPFPAKSKLIMERTQSGWRLIRRNFLFFPSNTVELTDSKAQIKLDAGFLVNKLVVSGDLDGKLIFSRRYSEQLDQVADQMGFQTSGEDFKSTPAIA